MQTTQIRQTHLQPQHELLPKRKGQNQSYEVSSIVRKPRTQYETSYSKILSIKPDSQTYIPVFSFASISQSNQNECLKRSTETESRVAQPIVDQYDNIIASLQSDLEQQRTECARQRELANNRLQRIAELQQIVDEVDAGSNATNRNAAVLQCRLDEVQMENAQLRRDCAQNDKECNALRQLLDCASQHSDKLEEQLLCSETHLKMNEKELVTVRRKLEFATRQNADLLQDSRRAVSNVESANQMVESLSIEKAQLVADAQQLKSRNEELMQRIQELQQFPEARDESQLSYEVGCAADAPTEADMQQEALDAQLTISQQVSELQRVLLQNQRVIDAALPRDCQEVETAPKDEKTRAQLAETTEELMQCFETVSKLREELDAANITILDLQSQLQDEHDRAQNVARGISSVVARGMNSLAAGCDAQELLAGSAEVQPALRDAREAQLIDVETQTTADSDVEAMYLAAKEQLEQLSAQLLVQRNLTESICAEMENAQNQQKSRANEAQNSAALQIEVLNRRIKQAAEHYASQQELDLAELSRARNELAQSQTAQKTLTEQLKLAISDIQRLENVVSDLQFQLAALSDDEIKRKMQKDARKIAFLRQQLQKSVLAMLLGK